MSYPHQFPPQPSVPASAYPPAPQQVHHHTAAPAADNTRLWIALALSLFGGTGAGIVGAAKSNDANNANAGHITFLQDENKRLREELAGIKSEMKAQTELMRRLVTRVDNLEDEEPVPKKKRRGR
jgi:uncharacterized protein HemX